MPLPTLIDRLQHYLKAALTPVPALLGGAYPATADQLPAVALSITDATERSRGIGRMPAPARTGALRVEDSIDLANAVLDFPGETVELLSGGRRVVHIPHGPLVRADGTPGPPFDAGDVRFAVGATVFEPVAGTPGAGQVQVDAATGELRVADALPNAGTLGLRYFVGEWEVRTFHYDGALSVETFGAEPGDVDALSRRIETALRDAPSGGVEGLGTLSATSWGPIVGSVPTASSALRRELRYRFDYELVEPLIGTAGGPIQTIAVTSKSAPAVTATPGSEHFDVTRQGSPDG